MTVTWVLYLCLAVSVLLSADAASLHKRHKRELLSSGWLESPGYGTTYPNNLNDVYYIDTDPSRPCVVTITYDAGVEYSTGCVYDRLVLNADAPDELVFCGNTDGNATYQTTVTDGQVKVVFTSDGSVPDRGFRLHYVVEPEQPAISLYNDDQLGTRVPSGRSFNDNGTPQGDGFAGEQWGDSGYFQSPNYPNSYPANYDGVYVAHLSSPGVQTVRVNYNYSIEYQSSCLFDYLQYGDGQRVCGQSAGSIDIPVNGDTVVFNFHSDNSVNDRGFQLQYEVVNDLSSFGGRSAFVLGDDPVVVSAESPPPLYTDNLVFFTDNFPSTDNDFPSTDNDYYTDYFWSTDNSFSTDNDYPSTDNDYYTDYFWSTDNSFSTDNDYPSTDNDYYTDYFWSTDNDFPSTDNDYYTDYFWSTDNSFSTDNDYPSADNDYYTDYFFSTGNSLSTDDDIFYTDDFYSPYPGFGYPTDDWPYVPTTPPVDRIDRINVFLPPEQEVCGLYDWTESGGYEYAFNNGRRTYHEAEQDCRVCGGQLITAKNEDEDELMQRVLQELGAAGTAYWLAATDIDAEGQWVWQDGTPMSYANWNRWEPDNRDMDSEDNADCLMVSKRGTWKDQDCSRTRKSVCKRQTGTAVATSPVCVDRNVPTEPTTPCASHTDITYVPTTPRTPDYTTYYTDTTYVPTTPHTPDYTTDYTDTTSFPPFPYTTLDSRGYTGYYGTSQDYGYTDYVTSYYDDGDYSSDSPAHIFPCVRSEINNCAHVFTLDMPDRCSIAFQYADCISAACNQQVHPELQLAVDLAMQDYCGVQSSTPYYGDYTDTYTPPDTNSSPDQRYTEYFQYGNSGYLQSPGYPEQYPNSRDHEVTVFLDQPGPQTVYLTFQDFELELNDQCAFDYVIINGDESNKLCGDLSGQTMSVEVPGDGFTVTFHSDGSVQGRGFNIYYSLPGLCDQDVLLASVWRKVQDANSQLTQTLTKWDELDQALSEVLEPMPDVYIG